MNPEQAQAIVEIEKLGGKVTVDERIPGKPRFVVDLSLAKVIDAGLQHLKALTHIQFLDLGRAEITDAGLEHLKELTKLQGLSLAGPKITDAGLEHLKGLTKLQWLFLVDTKLLTNIKVSDAWLEYLQGLPQRQSLDMPVAGLAGHQGNGYGTGEPPRAGQSRSKVTDTGFLKGLTNLQWLFLVNTEVTDTGLEHLKGLTKLQQLTLMGTKVTDKGMKNLQQALPACRIAKLP